MTLKNINRTLLISTIALFIFSLLIFFGRKLKDGGEVGRGDVFCLACLENTYYKTTSWEWKTNPDYTKISELIYISSELEISERALLIKILHTYSAMPNNSKTKDNPLASLAAQLFTSWGKHRPQIKLRIPYFATINNNNPVWPSFPLHSYFGSTLSWQVEQAPFALIMLSPFQTELDVTLSLAKSLFQLFDPYASDPHLPKSELLRRSWLDFRAVLFELQFWDLVRNFVEPDKLSGYRYEHFQNLWQSLKNKDYFSLYAWMLQQRQPRYKIQNANYYLALPAFKGKSPIESTKSSFLPENIHSDIVSTLFPTNSSALGAFQWTQFFSKDSPYDGIIISTELKPEIPDSDKIISEALNEMTHYIQIDNPNFHNEDAKIVFNQFWRQMGPSSVELPKNLSDNMNGGIKGDY